jgi:TolB protein
LLYQRCAYRQYPGHDRSDLCLSRADGSEHRLLTTGQSHWFAAAYGTPERHGSGSNCPVWSPDGRRIACALLLPGSRTAWPWQADRPDTDHFNRDYHPELARGGTQVCLIDPPAGRITPITHDEPPTWNFRLAWAPDGSRLATVRADVGCTSELWVMDADGGNRRFLTRGVNGTGVDHPRWVRLAVPSI